MKKSEAIDTAIISVIDNGNLDTGAMLNTLAVLFAERSSALWIEKRGADNAAS